MSTKHVYNNSDGLVLKALRGAVALSPDLRLHAPTKSVYSKTRYNGHVALISGGGAGHEPAHAGYTGRGMLAASVSGDIFASPSASQILSCIQLAIAAQQTKQVLLIVNNYTGDRLNFGLAAERAIGLSLLSALSSQETSAGKVEVETVVVADDVSLLDRPSLVGPRGLAGNILVCKILGAAAESSLNLSSLKKLGDAVVANLASVGVGLTHCHVPGRKTGSSNESDGVIEDGICELGLGLHNEPGVRRMEVSSPQDLVSAMLEQILLSKERKARAYDESEEGKKLVQPSDEVGLYVNNLGGMSMLEMSAIVDEAISQLEQQDVHPARVLLSSYMTSLNAPGFSLSLLNLSAICRDILSPVPENAQENIDPAKLLLFIDAPTETTAWTGVRTHWPPSGNRRDRAGEEEEPSVILRAYSAQSAKRQPSPSTSPRHGNDRNLNWTTLHVDPRRVDFAIRNACQAVLDVENDLTKFDTVVGDGDCGETFSSGARAALNALDTDELIIVMSSPSEVFQTLSDLLLNSMGGTSGALFGLYFTALSNALSPSSLPPSVPGDTDQDTSLITIIQKAPLSALQALSTHTPAQPGDRTIIDALYPFCHSLAAGEGLIAAVRKTREGAESTRGMRAKLGRATYVDNDDSESKGAEDPSLPPDPGAWGVAALLEGFAQGLQSSEEMTT